MIYKILIYIGNKILFSTMEKIIFNYIWFSHEDRKVNIQNRLLEEELDHCYSLLIKEKEQYEIENENENENENFIIVEF